MPDPVTFSAVAAATAMGGFLLEKLKGALSNEADARFKSFYDRFVDHLDGRRIPLGNTLDATFRQSLSKAAQALGWHLYDPDDRSWLDLLEHPSDWPKIVRRSAEIVQNNVVAGDARSAWIHNLINTAQQADAFDSIDLALALDDYRVTDAIAFEKNPKLRDHLHTQFLQWIAEEVPYTAGMSESEVRRLVEKGWDQRNDRQRLTFFAITAIFFREEIKADTTTFRAFTANVLTGLKADMDTLKASLPDRAMLKRLETLVAKMEAAAERQGQPDAEDPLTREFQEWIDKHLRKVLASLGRIEALGELGVSIGLSLLSSAQRSSDRLEKLHGEAALTRAGVSSIDTRMRRLEEMLSRASQQPTQPGQSPEVRFAQTLREWAGERGLTPETAQRELDAWIAETRNHATDLSTRARAEYLARNLAEATRLSDAAAEEKLRRLEGLNAERDRLTSEAIEDLERAGQSLSVTQEHAKALDCFQRALDLEAITGLLEYNGGDAQATVIMLLEFDEVANVVD
jgi:hypothetical protein